MNLVIIQARMGSTRLPGKVLMTIDGEPLLKIQLDRVKLSKTINQIVVATTALVSDDAIAEFCNANGIECFRGSELDVLGRYYEAAKKYGADLIVRLTADCPFSDPQVIDSLMALHVKAGVDYSSNTVPPENSYWPDGSDVEIFSFKALEVAYKNAFDPSEREHVTFYFWKNKEAGFKLAQMSNYENWSKYRFTVDYLEDLEVIKILRSQLAARKLFGHVNEIIDVLKKDPTIAEINSKYHFGIGWK